jgi:peptidyl-prolyl cis-trans isomerase SDCCAG10
MSQVYSTEPATTGRVVVDTTHGPIDIELWCKECPTTTRTFLQLCLDGYYDGMIFHRILSDFLIQTGLTRDGGRLAGGTPAAEIDGYLRGSTAAPPSFSGVESTSSSSGGGGGAGDALGRDRKRLEVNPRIRFNHRGQVAMAFPLETGGAGGGGGGGDDENEDDEEEGREMLRYQFFVTLDEAPFLDARHVVFGTVAGATVFNALRIGRTDADERTGVPTDAIEAPPRIRGVRVDHHPFGDMVVTADGRVPWKRNGGGASAATASGGGEGDAGGGKSEMERRRKRRKGKRDLNVLSFGDEERDYEEILAGDDVRGGGMTSRRSRDIPSGESRFLSSKVDADVEKQRKSKDNMEENDLKVDANGGSSGRGHNSSSERKPISYVSEPQGERNPNELEDERENGGVAPEVGRSEPKIESGAPKDDRNVASSKLNPSRGMGAVEARRTRYLKSGIGSSANKEERLKREGETMARLLAFKNKVLETRRSGKDGTGDNGGGRKPAAAADDSLASRMVKRAKQTKDEERRRRREEEALADMPGYSGRVNGDDGGEDGDDADAEDWIGTKFKCKRHMDQDSRMMALNGIDADGTGGDGRRMEDYVVLDEKRRGKGGRNEHRNGGEHVRRRTGSADHAGRRHRGSDHHRPAN